MECKIVYESVFYKTNYCLYIRIVYAVICTYIHTYVHTYIRKYILST